MTELTQERVRELFDYREWMNQRNANRDYNELTEADLDEARRQASKLRRQR